LTPFLKGINFITAALGIEAEGPGEGFMLSPCAVSRRKDRDKALQYKNRPALAEHPNLYSQISLTKNNKTSSCIFTVYE